MEMVQQAVADYGRKGATQGCHRIRPGWVCPSWGRPSKGQVHPQKTQLRPRTRMALLMFCGKGHHAGRPIETQHPGPGQGCGEAKADIARPAAQVHDPSSWSTNQGRGRRPGPGQGEWLPQQRQETLRKCLVGAIEISLGVGPRLEGIIHQFRFDDPLHAPLPQRCRR
jgi:hypothetical protein